MNLIIIEGAGKKDTIEKYLGKDYEVVATKGHIRDLPVKSLGVDIKENFAPKYQIMDGKDAIVKQLQTKSKKADRVYLATDPDREGEAISWHLCHILGLDEKDPVRIEFNEISKKAVEKALQNPRAIDKNLVDAQQARRILDRLVGYKMSPIICKKIQPKLSAGRVQSVALKLVVEREKEITNFVPEEFWTLIASLYKNDVKESFKSSLNKVSGKRHKVTSKEEMDTVLKDLKENPFVVQKVTKSLSKQRASAPYTTSTMQQDALNKLGMNLRRASMCAQNLYEGVEIGGQGKVALVTYIRTDSVRVAPDAVAAAKSYIQATYGDKYVPAKPNFYRVKKSAQDAHEAIRPISLEHTPESVKPYLSSDNYRLYKLIYNRFLASQMTEATFNAVTVEIENGKYNFRATGKTPLFDGHLVLYKDEKTNKKENDDDDETNDKDLPELSKGDVLNLEKLTPAQKFTRPPARYTEASLVKEMEEKGIGRPATYTPTILTLANRNYTEREGRYIKPTELAFKVIELLDKYFKDEVNVKFTAAMEDKLDDIAQNGTKWQDLITEFYDGFSKKLEIADKDSTTFKQPPKPTDIKCEKCGHMMVIRNGRFGEFVACSNFPACRNILNIEKTFGKCPKCDGKVTEKRSKRGKVFYGCTNYPKCDFVSWDLPTGENCPKCKEYLTKKEAYGKMRIKCSNKDCDYVNNVEIEQKE